MDFGVSYYKKPAMNIHIKFFAWTYVFVSPGQISRSGTAELYVKCIRKLPDV